LRGWQSQYGATPSWDGTPHPQPAVDAILAAVKNHPGEIVIVALGPLTNLAMALRRAPQIATKVEYVVAMGGSLTSPSPAEFNIRCDPEAAAIVFGAPWPVRLHGLEITRQCLFTPQDFAALDGANPAIALLKAQAAQWIPIVEAQGWETGGCSLHDAVAASALFHDDFFTYQSGHSVQVTLNSGPSRGITNIASQDKSGRVSVATRINAPDCRASILSRLQSDIRKVRKEPFSDTRRPR
jgi:purine nucleosidase